MYLLHLCFLFAVACDKRDDVISRTHTTPSQNIVSSPDVRTANAVGKENLSNAPITLSTSLSVPSEIHSDFVGLIEHGDDNIPMGCSCAFTKKGNSAGGYLFVSNFKQPSHGWIKIDRQVQEVINTESREPDGLQAVFKSSSVIVRINIDITKKGYEGDSREGKIEVIKPDESQVLIVEGVCGC